MYLEDGAIASIEGGEFYGNYAGFVRKYFSTTHSYLV